MEQEELPLIDDPVDQSLAVTSIELMESELRRGGPKYTILESFNLGK